MQHVEFFKDIIVIVVLFIAMSIATRISKPDPREEPFSWIVMMVSIIVCGLVILVSGFHFIFKVLW